MESARGQYFCRLLTNPLFCVQGGDIHLGYSYMADYSELAGVVGQTNNSYRSICHLNGLHREHFCSISWISRDWLAAIAMALSAACSRALRSVSPSRRVFSAKARFSARMGKSLEGGERYPTQKEAHNKATPAVRTNVGRNERTISNPAYNPIEIPKLR